MGRLRCLLRGRAYGRSNQDVRALLSRPALWSILAARRISLLRCLIKQPLAHVPCLAAVTGT
eukprot:777643-Heterocapsa_arctica.AAC.1